MPKHDPCPPSEHERSEHEMTHIPLWSWCGHCIKGTGREEDCLTMAEEERRVAEVHLDYMFMVDEKEGNVDVLCCTRGRRSLYSAQRCRGQQREVGQRACFDELDRVIEQLASDEGRFTDDCRRTFRWAARRATGPSRATHSVRGMVRSLRSSLQETLE